MGLGACPHGGDGAGPSMKEDVLQNFFARQVSTARSSKKGMPAPRCATYGRHLNSACWPTT